MKALGDVFELADQELVSALADVFSDESALAAARLTMLAETDRRGLAIKLGHSSVTRWYARSVRITDGSAARQTALGHWLTDWPTVLGALAGGEIHAAHASAIADGYTTVVMADRTLDEQHRGAVVAELLDTARRSTPVGSPLVRRPWHIRRPMLPGPGTRRQRRNDANGSGNRPARPLTVPVPVMRVPERVVRVPAARLLTVTVVLLLAVPVPVMPERMMRVLVVMALVVVEMAVAARTVEARTVDRPLAIRHRRDRRRCRCRRTRISIDSICTRSPTVGISSAAMSIGCWPRNCSPRCRR